MLVDQNEKEHKEYGYVPEAPPKKPNEVERGYVPPKPPKTPPESPKEYK